MLARRAQASAESTKKRKKDSEQDKAKKALKTLAQTKKRGLRLHWRTVTMSRGSPVWAEVNQI